MVEVKIVACDLTHLITPLPSEYKNGYVPIGGEYTEGYDTPSFFTLTKQLIF